MSHEPSLLPGCSKQLRIDTIHVRDTRQALDTLTEGAAQTSKCGHRKRLLQCGYMHRGLPASNIASVSFATVPECLSLGCGTALSCARSRKRRPRPTAKRTARIVSAALVSVIKLPVPSASSMISGQRTAPNTTYGLSEGRKGDESMSVHRRSGEGPGTHLH